MLFQRVLYAAVCLCVAVPAWASGGNDGKLTAFLTERNSPKKAPALREFVEKIWAQSPAVQRARAAVEAARESAVGARRPLHNPVLALEAERTDVSTTALQLSQTIDWSNKREALAKVAQQDVQTAQADLQHTHQRVAVVALQALVEYFTAMEMHSLALRRSQLMKGFVDTVKRRYSAGDVQQLDVAFAQVAYSEALMAQATREGDLAAAEANLQAASGLFVEEWPPLPQQPLQAPESVDPSFLDSLPHLAVLRSRSNSAKAQLKLAEREGRVEPTLGLRLGREDEEALLGLSLEIPLFVRNSYRSVARAASYKSSQVEQDYRLAYQQAKARLSGSLGRFTNSSRAWRAWITTGQQAHLEQIALLEKMWHAGELTATDFHVQAKQSVDTLITATSLKGEVWQAAIAWLEASGQVEAWLGIKPNAHTRPTNFGVNK